MRAPIDVDGLWPSLRAAVDASRRGTELLQALHRLLVLNNPSSKAWQEERRKLLDAIEALVAASQSRARVAGAYGQSDQVEKD